ncbi:MAG: PPC domain-containing protein [Planctomycetaceae bacterium]|nr:PPC domain-containing protein [Planctomycetales bacterium]MCB9923127.1 PPC domain-containing protein [Planctomycetaceae bacterium]
MNHIQHSQQSLGRARWLILWAQPTFLLLLIADVATAQTSYPMLMSLKPVAAQVGQISEHTLKSRYTMLGAYDVIVTGEGVKGEIIPPEIKEGEKPNLQEIKIRFDVASDALPGVRDFRIGTPTGVSTLGQLVIAADAVAQEVGANDTRDKANAITLPATVCGAIEKAEDVDYFKFTVEAGQTLSFHVRSQRLQDRIHDLQQHVDPILSIRDGNGTTLVASDNYFFADPYLHYQFKHAGEYFLEIRDVRYQGNQYWEYAIEVHDRPFITNVHPMAVGRGQQTKFEFVGYQLPEQHDAFVSIPLNKPTGAQWWELPLGESVTNPTPVVVSDLPVVTERDLENNTPETAQYVSLPVGITGRIESESDIDCYSFAAMKGERFSFEVIARRQQSAIDSHLRILDATGKQLTLNDDMRIGKRNFSDSLIENWTAPADGTFAIEIRDLHLRGGADFVYFVRATRSLPSFDLFVDTDKTQLTPGTGGVIFVRAERKNGFTGEIQLGIEGLPTGVEASCGRILSDKGQDGCVVLTAAADAKMSLANVRISGHATHIFDGGDPLQIEAFALPYQETYQPGGGRGHWPAEMHTISIGESSDILGVALSEYDVRLKPGESKKIDIKIERAEGFDKNVTLDVTYNHLSSVYGDSLPKGVTLDKPKSKTLLTGKTAEGHITLTATKDAAPVERQQICVMANVSLNFVMKATYASKPLFVSVEASEPESEKK